MAPPEREPLVLLDLTSDAAMPRVRVNSGIADLAELSAWELRTRGFAAASGSIHGVGESSWVEFESVVAADRSLVIGGRPAAAERRSEAAMEVSLNGTPVETVALRKREAEYSITLPAGAMISGVNRVTLVYLGEMPANAPARKRRFEWSTLRLADQDRPPSPAVGDGEALQLPFLVRYDFFERIPAGAELSLDGITTFGIGRGARLRIEILGEGDDEPTVRVLERGEESTVIDPGLNGRAARISLVALPGPGVDPLAGGIEVAIAQVRLRTAEEPRSQTHGPRVVAGSPNVIVYLIDTLRADHLGLYGYEHPTSPRIDEFAGDAVTFDRLQAQSSWTKPVVASLLTGLLPQQHGVIKREDVLDPAALTLPGLMQLAGYETLSIVTNGTVGSYFNFDIGYHHFEQLGERRTPEVHQLSDVVNERFFSWLDERGTDRPFFAMLHTTDPHEPYAPRQPFRDQFAADVLRPDVVRGQQVPGLLDDDPSVDIERISTDLVRLYDAEIAFNDAQFGALLDHLRARGLYSSTLIVLLSDHGEEFREHGGWSHGNTLFQEQLHVPLVVKLPGEQMAGTRVSAVAQHIDIPPTVFDVIGLTPATPWPGTSLLDLTTPDAPERPASSHLAITDTVREAARWDDQKLTSILRPGEDAHVRLFDLDADPGETRSVLGDRPVVAGYLHTFLHRLARLMTPGAADGPALDPEMTEQLRALGYIQ